MVKHNGFTVEVLPAQPKQWSPTTSSSTAQPSSITTTDRHMVIRQSYVPSSSPHKPSSLTLRIGSEATDRTIRVHVAVALNSSGVPLHMSLPTQQDHHSFVLRARGLYDGQWRDRGLWHDISLPTPTVANNNANGMGWGNATTPNMFTVQVHFYETMAASAPMMDYDGGTTVVAALARDGPLLQTMTVQLVQQQQQQQHQSPPQQQQQLPLQPSSAPNRSTIGTKRPEQTFGYDQKAMFWKRRRICSSENVMTPSTGWSFLSPPTTTTTAPKATDYNSMVMG